MVNVLCKVPIQLNRASYTTDYHTIRYKISSDIQNAHTKCQTKLFNKNGKTKLIIKFLEIHKEHL